MDKRVLTVPEHCTAQCLCSVTMQTQLCSSSRVKCLSSLSIQWHRTWKQQHKVSVASSFHSLSFCDKMIRSVQGRRIRSYSQTSMYAPKCSMKIKIKSQSSHYCSASTTVQLPSMYISLINLGSIKYWQCLMDVMKYKLHHPLFTVLDLLLIMEWSGHL